MRSSLTLAGCGVLATVAAVVLSAPSASTPSAGRTAGVVSTGVLGVGFPAVGFIAEKAMRCGGLLAISREIDDQDATFGACGYETLTARGRRDAITSRMDYSGIQALKSASRSKVLDLFEGSGRPILAAIETGTPGELASYLCGFADGRAGRWMDVVRLGGMLWS